MKTDSLEDLVTEKMQEHRHFDKIQKYAAENPEKWGELLQEKADELMEEAKNKRPVP